jgi:hypothetical protein
LARFSAQSVSITPISGWSTASVNPRSFQKPCNCGHSCSGGTGTASQRWLPWRSRRTSPMFFGATAATAVAAVAAVPAWYCAALTLPPLGWKRESRPSWLRSGGTSRPRSRVVPALR